MNLFKFFCEFFAGKNVVDEDKAFSSHRVVEDNYDKGLARKIAIKLRCAYPGRVLMSEDIVDHPSYGSVMNRPGNSGDLLV